MGWQVTRTSFASRSHAASEPVAYTAGKGRGALRAEDQASSSVARGRNMVAGGVNRRLRTLKSLKPGGRHSISRRNQFIEK